MNARYRNILIALVLFVFAASSLAYVNLIPSGIKHIPFHDSIGHFILFGLLGLIAELAFQRRKTLVFGRLIPLGASIILAYAFVDEVLQIFSDNRTFDTGDLFSGILGIIFFVGAEVIWRKRKSIFSFFALKEFIAFGIKQARASLFAGLFLFLLFASNYFDIPGLYRYDFLFVAAILIQVLMIVFRLETTDEAKTIFLFHIIGLVLEIYKTSPMVGSWSYPEPGFFKIMNVPLYSGFMYAAVGSYIAHATKVLKQRYVNHPPHWLSLVLCFLIYLNFFTNHFIYDYRAFLLVLIFLMYFRTDVHFTPRQTEYKMPLALGFVLIACFVWIAENIGTIVGAWQYPHQVHSWEVVSLQKITSWFLMVIICFIVVTYLKHFKTKRDTSKTQ
jgi:uncharacterized membrane protein YoaT (DUF817 family)